MSLVLSSIVGGVNEQDSIMKSICADNWTTEQTIIKIMFGGSYGRASDV